MHARAPRTQSAAVTTHADVALRPPLEDRVEAEHPSRPLHAAASLVLPCVVLLAATVIAWLRIPPIVRGTLWAEDLRNFLSGDVHGGLVHTLFQPYGGYLQVVPRLIAALVAHLVPIDQWATAVAFTACAAAGIVTAVIYVCASQILGSRLLGVAAASITVLDPLAAHEVLGNLANLHWFVIWMMPWVLLYRPRSRWAGALLGAIALLAVLSEFDVVLFLPLLAWRWRDRAMLTVRVPYLIGCLAELVAEIASPRGRPAHVTFGAADAIAGYLINVAMSLVTPIRTQMGALLHASGTMIGVLFVAAAAALVVYILRHGDARLRILAVVISVLSPGLFISAIELTPESEYAYAHLDASQLIDPWLVRYGVVPSMLLLSLIPIAAAAQRTSRRHRVASTARLVRIAAVGLLAVPLLAHVGPANDDRRAQGPSFAPQVVEALQDCSAAPHDLQQLTAAPGPKWEITLSCEQLEHGEWSLPRL